MGLFQYSGGVGAQLANALSNVGKGYEQGVDDKLKRAQESAQTAGIQQQTTNAGYDQPNKIADEIQSYILQYGVPAETATNAVRYAHGMPPIPSSAPSPTGPTAPAPPMPSPTGGSAGNLGTPAPSPIPIDPGMTPGPPSGNGSGNLGLPAQTNPVTQAFAPIVPPPAPGHLPAGVAQAFAPISPSPNPMPMGASAPITPLPAVTPALPATMAPTAQPAPNPAYQPFDPQAPSPTPLALRQAEIMWGSRKQIQDEKNVPVMQKTFEASLGNSGILPTDDDDTKALKVRQQIEAANQMQQSMGYPPNDPTGPLMSRVLSTGGILASVKDTTGSDKQHSLDNYFTGKLAIGQQNANTNAARVAFLGSDTEQKVIKNIGDLPPGFQQRAAVTAWNTAHPTDTLPVPDGNTTPYYKPGDAEQSLIGLRSQQAAYEGDKSKFYKDYISSVIGDKNKEAFLANQRALALPYQVTNEIQKTNNQQVYQDGLLGLKRQGLDYTDARWAALINNSQYKDLQTQDTGLRNQIDTLNGQEEKAKEKLTGQSLTDFLAQTEKLKTDLQAKQSQAESQRQVLENTTVLNLAPPAPSQPIRPAPTQVAPIQFSPTVKPGSALSPQTRSPYALPLPRGVGPLPAVGAPTAAPAQMMQVPGRPGLTVDQQGNVYKNGQPTGHRIK